MATLNEKHRKFLEKPFVGTVTQRFVGAFTSSCLTRLLFIASLTVSTAMNLAD